MGPKIRKVGFFSELMVRRMHFNSSQHHGKHPPKANTDGGDSDYSEFSWFPVYDNSDYFIVNLGNVSPLYLMPSKLNGNF